MPPFKPPKNDKISLGLEDLVPAKYKGTDQYLDVVTWNIRYFHDLDKQRVNRVVDILSALNADIIVLQEIRDQSLDAVAEKLTKDGAGNYEVNYGTTGGNQRVAVMHDLDWVRSKDDVRELFGKGQIKADGKDAFPRLPLLGIFTTVSPDATGASQPFDFQLLGLHLKSQRGGGGGQRRKAAEALRNWLEHEAPAVDADVILVGDWNAPPDDAAWEPLQGLEQQGKAKFRSINDKTAISHLMYKNKQEIGSRLDLGAISMAAFDELHKPPAPVHWKSLDKLLATNPKAKQIRNYIKQVREKISDHMPVVVRFYIDEQSPAT